MQIRRTGLLMHAKSASVQLTICPLHSNSLTRGRASETFSVFRSVNLLIGQMGNLQPSL